MNGYFDIHSHILPGVDDGAKDMNETRRMLLTAYEEGIRIIVATPHYVAGKTDISIGRLMTIYDEVNQTAASVSKDYRIVLGNELFFNQELINALEKGEALTIDGTRYILIEFLPDTTYEEMKRGLSCCIYAGYIPILAHAERYYCLYRNLEYVDELIKSGAYIQLNLSCITGKPMNSRTIFGHQLLKRKWVHFLGTDTHDTYYRAPFARKAVTIMKKRYGENTVRQLLWENPMTMIENKHL
ncbi:MAG: Protein-tyrosine-phosphatase [Herbinix sp.]|nr:Protein-tyrosine-phosphatase [Herbinix sp.]